MSKNTAILRTFKYEFIQVFDKYLEFIENRNYDNDIDSFEQFINESIEEDEFVTK